MKTEFISYELALRMKQLGFDEECLAIYSNANPKTGLYTLKKYRLKLIKQASQKDKGVKAPLFQQAFRWFREKYHWTIKINQVTKNNWSYTLDNFPNERTYYGKLYETFDVTELACIEKLIEIVEQSKSE